MMRIFRKAISVLLVAFVVLGAVPLSGFVGVDLSSLNFLNFTALAAGYGGYCGSDMRWSFNTGTGVLSITGTGAMHERSEYYDIPWRHYATQIKSISVGHGVTHIASYAFYNCTNVTKISLPDTLQSIGYPFFVDTAYYKNKSNWSDNVLYIGNVLVDAGAINASYSIREGTKSILNEAFYGCGLMTDIIIPDTVVYIGESAFENCDGLSSVTIPDSVETIGKNAFRLCDNLVKLKIGKAVRSIGKNTSPKTYGNIAFEVDEENEFYSSDEHGVLFGGTEIIHYPANSEATKYVIPDGVVSVADYAFYKSNLKKTVIPESVQKIGDYAFAYSKAEDVVIPDGVVSIGQYAFNNCSRLKCAILSDSVTTVGSGAFTECYNLECLHLPAYIENARFSVYRNSSDYICATADDGNAKAIADEREIEFRLCDGHSVDEIAGEKCGNNLTWTFDENIGELEIKGSGPMYDFYSDSVPWASFSSDIKSIKISNEATTIGSYAFSDCDGITEITIPESITAIGSSAFSACSNLIRFTLNDGITRIGSYAFSGCPALVSVTIPGSVTELGEGVFKNCESLTSVTFLEGAESTGRGTFWNCNNLISVTLPDSLKIIDNSAFYECESLANINFPENLETIGESAFRFCGRLENITFPDSLRTICSGAFGYCHRISNVTIPAGVTKIEPYAFTCSFSLKSITVDENNLYYSNDSSGALYNKDKTELVQYPLSGIDKNITVSETVTKIGDGAFVYCAAIETVVLPVGVTEIGSYAFDRCIRLEKIKIPHTVTTIKGAAFIFCDSLRFVIIPESVTRIEGNTFASCNRLDYVHIPESVTYISDNAFYDSVVCICSESEDCYANSYAETNRYSFFDTCKGHGDKYGIITGQCGDNLTFTIDIIEEVLEISGTGEMWKWTNDFYPLWADYTMHFDTVIIGDEVTNISSASFHSNENIKKVVIGKSVRIIDEYAFGVCDITEITIPYGVESIGAEAFFGCGKLKSLTIPDSVKTIGNHAFAFCSSMESVTLGNGVTDIGREAFLQCTALEKVTVLDAEVNIGAGAFSECVNLGNVNLGNNAKSIGERAFMVCEKLKSIDIPDSVTSIGVFAFAGCGSLEQVHLPANPDSIGDGIVAGTTAYICAATDNCYAETYAEENGIEFRICNGHYVYGRCGDNITWVLCLASGDLVIKGKGAMYDPAFSFDVPWHSYTSKIKSVEITDGVTHISDYAFYNCRSLSEITIPDSVTSIGYMAFNYTGIYNNYSNWENGVLYLNGKYLIGAKSTLNGFYSVNDGTKVIANSAFEKCTDLTSVSIPSSITDIGENAFYACNSLADASYSGSEEEWNKVNVESGNENLLNALKHFNHSHSFDAIVDIPPTCTEDGRSIMKCKCGATNGYITLPKVSHVPGEWETVTLPDCVNDGTEKRACSLCGAEETRTTSASGHDYDYTRSESNLTRPTETSEGYYTFVCKKQDCGSSVTESVKRADYSSYNEALAKLEDCLWNSALTDKAKQELYDMFAERINNNDYYDENSKLRQDLTEEEQAIVDASTADILFIIDEADKMLSDDSYIRADYSAIDSKINELESRFSDSSVSGKLKEEFNSIKAEVEELKKDSDASHADVRETLESLSDRLDEILITVGNCESGNHSFTNYATVKEADCVNAGINSAECDYGCGAVDETEIPAFGHDIITDKAVEATCTETGLAEGQHCLRCNGATVEQEVIPAKGHNYVTEYDSAKHWKECDCGSITDEQNHSFAAGNVCSCGFARATDSSIKIQNNTGSKTINYGETLRLTAIVTDKPSNAKIYWYVDGVKSGEGEVFNVNFESGTKTVTVKLVDENGVVYQSADGNEISDSENITVKSGLFQKIIAFFKKLFGLNQVIPQAFKVI